MLRARAGDTAIRLADLPARRGQIEEPKRKAAAGMTGAATGLRRVRSREPTHGD